MLRLGAMSSEMAFPHKEIKEKSVSKTEKNGEVDVSSYVAFKA
ncbi:hypothetical protein CK203_050910 [Vitis vinifera]|uniref:Uncharacterized protein n=1 Tax=Vitis vinifera TaxID=29760 RepID=A0A438GQT5_VITVI|nr:hypothetical protein CK203_050910 [Vitis vinifera]